MRVSILTAAFLAGLLVGIGLSGRTQTYAVVSGLAVHLDHAEHCNSTTTGLGVERPLSGDSLRYAVGFYRNSGCKWSVYSALAWLPLHVGAFRLGGIAGGVTGYGSPVLPAGGLVLAFEPKTKIAWNLIFIPPVGAGGSGVLWGQLKFRWD